MTQTANLGRCPCCKGEPEPGYIETGNNGPIVPCPMCNAEDDYDRAERQRLNKFAAENRARQREGRLNGR